MKAKKVRITVLRKTFNQDFVDAYTEGFEWKPRGCCHDFAVGQEFFSDGHMPDGFSDWAWTDIQKYVVVLARGGNMVGVKPGVFVTCCTDGFRPVFFKLERVDEDESMRKDGTAANHSKISRPACDSAAQERAL